LIDKHLILKELKAYRSSMSEFEPDETDYLIDLVERDIELEESVNIG